MLTQFTQPAILRQIGHIRLAKFLDSFKDNLAPAPPDLLSTIKVQSGSDEPSVDFTSLAAALALTYRLPDRLPNALFTLEAAACPENRDRLQDAIHRRIPCVGVNWQCPLDCALELWFAAPDELSQFESSAGVSPAASNGEESRNTQHETRPANLQPGTCNLQPPTEPLIPH